MKDWEKRFDERFEYVGVALDYYTNNAYSVQKKSGEEHLRDIKHFLATALEEQRKELAVTENTSDGYHTFKELYEFRKLYNAALFNEWASRGVYQVHKSMRHSDGELCFGGGWFIVVATLPTGQISNHYEIKDWDLFKCKEQDKAKTWDGHTEKDVIERLQAILTERTPMTEPQPTCSCSDYKETKWCKHMPDGVVRTGWNEPQLSAESRPRRFGKSTFVTDAFRAESSAGNSVKFEHPDYVCFSRKAWEEQQKAAKQAIATALEEQRQKVLEEVEGWLVDEEIEKVNVPHVSAKRGHYVKTKDPSSYTRNKFRAELRAKLNQLKGERK